MNVGAFQPGMYVAVIYLNNILVGTQKVMKK